MLERRSAIAEGVARGGSQPHGSAGCRLGEVRGWALLQVAGFPGTFGEVERALAIACGAMVPTEVGRAVASGPLTLLRTGPEQIWLIGQGETLPQEPALRSTIAQGHGVLTPLSHSRTRMFVEGPAACDVLGKGIAIDVAPEVFGIGRFAMTGLDHTPVLLHRTAHDRYELYAMRTFALTVWSWLTDAALQYGYEVEPSGA